MQLLLRITDVGLVGDPTVFDKVSMLVVDTGTNEFVVLLLTEDISLVDVNVDESGGGAIVVGRVVDCGVGGGVDCVTNVFATVDVEGVDVSIAESAIDCDRS